MSYYHNDNTAYDWTASPDRWTSPYQMPDEVLEEKKKEQEEELLHRRRDMEIYRRHKKAGQEKFRRVATAALILASALSLSAFLRLRDSQIASLNFANTRMKNQISEVMEENDKVHNALLSQIESEQIEQEALKAFGLRKPTQMQRIVVQLKESDKTVYHNDDRATLSRSADNNNYNVLEAYMKAQRLQQKQKE